MLERMAGAVDQAVHDSALEARRNVAKLEIAGGDCPLDGAFQPGEGEMRLGGTGERPRQRNGRGISALRQLFDRRPSRISKPKKLARLVERLASGIVNRGCEPAVITHGAHLEQLAMPARDEQQQIGKTQVRIGEPGRKRMSLEMIDRE